MTGHAVSLPGTAPAAGGGARRGGARVLPGFNLTLGITVLYLSLIVLIPLSALVFKTFTLTWPQFWEAVTSPRVLASYRLTFGASFIAACVNVVFGLLVAWVLVRSRARRSWTRWWTCRLRCPPLWPAFRSPLCWPATAGSVRCWSRTASSSPSTPMAW
jgi:ABC-type Fe3+ transport system permease subunit